MSAVASQQPRHAASQHRRSMIGKIHVAKKQLGMVDDDYRVLLFDTVGETSAADCSDAQLVKVIDALKAKGFAPVMRTGASAPAGGFSGRRRPADHPMARKARALWISLYHLNVVRNKSEAALEAFACRQLKVEALQWADQAQCYKLVEALKDMGRRNGWNCGERADKKPVPIVHLQRRLCEAILAKLVVKGAAAESWDLPTAAFRLTGETFDFFGGDGTGGGSAFAVETYTRCAAALGQKLRTISGGN